jgi:hypothetical protein
MGKSALPEVALHATPPELRTGETGDRLRGMPSLFRRVTRYCVSPTQNPAENRLTEITGAVLERVNGLAADVARALTATAADAANAKLLDVHGEAESKLWQDHLDHLTRLVTSLRGLSSPAVRVATQRTTASGKFVDLELRLEPPPFQPGDRFLFWLEVKHGASVHGTQLTDYLKDIEAEDAGERLVLVLAPRQSIDKLGDVPEAMPVIEWQAVADAVRRWAKRPELEPVDRFLLEDYLEYLREEGLMDAEVLTAEHAFVLGAMNEAWQAAGKLIEVADSLVQERWGLRQKSAGGQKPAYGPDYWAEYFAASGEDEPAATWRSTTFWWGMYPDTYRDEPRNAYVFFSGATFYVAKDNPANLPENLGWRAGMRKHDFESVSSYWWRLWRHLYPEELLVEKTLTDQADRLASWVVGSFELLAANPPPN